MPASPRGRRAGARSGTTDRGAQSRGELLDRQRRDLREHHGAVARKPLVLGRDLPGLVGELPRRIGKDGAEAALADELEHVASNGIHEMQLAVERISRARNTACDSGNTKRSWSRFQLHIRNLHTLERPASPSVKNPSGCACVSSNAAAVSA